DCDKLEMRDNVRVEMLLLSGDKRKALGEVEARLAAEHRERAGAGAVGLLDAVGKHALHEIKILAHPSATSRGLSGARFVSRKKSLAPLDHGPQPPSTKCFGGAAHRRNASTLAALAG